MLQQGNLMRSGGRASAFCAVLALSVASGNALALDVKGILDEVNVERTKVAEKPAKKESRESAVCLEQEECKAQAKALSQKAIETGDLSLLNKSLSAYDDVCFSHSFDQTRGRLCDEAATTVAKFLVKHKDKVDGVQRIALAQKSFRYEYRACKDFGIPESCTRAFKLFVVGYRPIVSSLVREGYGALDAEDKKKLSKGYEVARKSCLSTKNPKVCYYTGVMLFKIGDTVSSKKFFNISCEKGYQKACKAYYYGLPSNGKKK